MAFAKINWKPSARELRLFAAVLFVALGLVGSLFYFRYGKEGFAFFLWGFGALSFATGITGTALGKPCYWIWMSFVLVVSTVIGYTALIGVFLFVLFPLGLMARLMGRDRLKLKRPRAEGSLWEAVKERTDAANYERQF